MSMIASITSIQLKSPFKLLAFYRSVLPTVKQLQSGPCVQFRTKGFWTRHYTISLWNNTEEMRAFATSGAHLDAMKKRKQVATEVRTISIQTDTLPEWKTALAHLEKGKVLKF